MGRLGRALAGRSEQCSAVAGSYFCGALGSERPQQYGLARRINYLPAEEPVQLSAMHALLTSIEERVQCLPEELPLYVTLITDNPSPELTSSFSNL